MPNVVFDKTSDVTATLTINVSKDELDQKLKAELNKARKTANLKGFRKGKAPLSTLRKMMGNDLLSQIMDREINESLFGYIDENKVEVIFSPMPAKEQELVDIDAKNVQDVALVYDLALRPEFELKVPGKTFDKFVLLTDDDFIDERVSDLRKQLGESKEVEKGIQDNDVVTVTFTQLDEAGKPVEGGITNETKLFTDSLEDKLKEELTGKDVGFETKVDPTKVEKSSTDTYVKKYLLGLDGEEAEMPAGEFQLKVEGITRVSPAELDEEFFKKFDPSGEVTDEAGLRKRIQEDNAAGFNKQGDSMLDFQIQKELVENTKMELPTEFLKRVNEDQEQSLERFERGIRWMMIRNEYAKQHELQVTQEDISEAAASQLIGMMGGQRPEWLNDEFIDNYAARMMEDEKQRDELIYRTLETKIMESLRGEVKTKDIAITADDFNEKIKEFNEEFKESEEE
ncbi:hypothetical protein CEQ90_01610 [Lewinellaceae bacterium SD302]|nr:hypothetical protein CEQ90_01610 [Lewinellaceae bacterium SD302]